MVPVTQYLMLSGLLLGISLMGMLLNRQNVILLLICIELMLLAVNTNFIAFAHYYQLIAGQVVVFFILTVAAAEAAIGLAIVLRLYRQQGSINVNSMAHLKG